MSFPFSHIPANLTKLVFTGPFSHVPVNLGVSENPVEPEVCWDLWQEQKSNKLKIVFNDEWTEQAGDELTFTWFCPVEECIGAWEYQHGSAVNFDNWTNWENVPGYNVDFNFTCETTPEECTTLWVDYPGNVVPVAFTKPWQTYQGNQVPIAFKCEGGGDTPDFTYFTGYLDTGTGSNFGFDFEGTSIANAWVGEEFTFNINDFSETIRPHFETGEFVGGTSCNQEIDAVLDIILSNSIISSSLDTNNGYVSVGSGGSGTGGANFVNQEPIPFGGDISFIWNQTLTGGYYDNDQTNAQVRFEAFFTDDYDSLNRPTSAWTYSDPGRWATPNNFSVWLPFGSGGIGRAYYKLTSDSGYGTNLFSFTVPFNLFDGTRTLRVSFIPSGSETVVELWADATLLGSGTIPVAPPSHLAPVWHYHNYSNSSTVYELNDVEITGCVDFLTTFPAGGIGVIQNADGQTANAELATDMLFDFSFYAGEELAPTYLASEIYLEDVELVTGEYSSAILTQNLPWEITANVRVGESVLPILLNTTQLLDFNSYVGETSSIVLDSAQFWDFVTGEHTFFDLDIFPGQTFGDIRFYNGETNEAELATTDSLDVTAFTGEEIDGLYLATDTYLDNVEFFTGEYATADLTQNLPWQIVANAYDGQSGVVDLSTTDTLRATVYVGEMGEIDIDLRPAPEMLVQAHVGETATIDVSIAQNLGDLDFADGSHATIATVDNEPFWDFVTGEEVTADLATETTLPADAQTGESATADLDIRPSEGMGVFIAASGEQFNFVINVLKAVLLYPNLISARDEIVCEFDISTSFDLLNTTCCPIKDTHERIELTEQPAPDEHYDGDKTVVQVDLSTLPRFEMDFFDGANFRGIDPNYIGEINVYDGHVPTVGYLDFEFVDFRLCYGNFVPDGDFAFIELVSTYDDGCYADFIFVGEEANAELQNNVQFDLNMHAGEHMFCEVYIEPIMRLNVYVGEFARISNPEFEVRVYDGPSVTFDFFEEGWPIYEGATMEITTLTTEYDVAFLERGCLENEYVPTNENGDPDWDNFNPVPVELEIYSHSIKAHCF